MKILIIGGGSIGFITAEYFMKEGHDVTVIEHDAARVKTLQESLDIHVLQGKGTDLVVLKEAKVGDMQLFLALSDDDETNIIACSFARIMGVGKKIARVNNPYLLTAENTVALKELGVDEIVNTEQSIIQEVINMVRYPGATEVKQFLDREMTVVVFSFNRESPYYGKPLKTIEFDFPAIPLGYEQVSDLLPYNEEVIVNEFLYVYYACESKLLPRLHKKILPQTRAIRNVMIYGAGFKSSHTAGELGMAIKKEGVSRVELVMDDIKGAEVLSAKYPLPVILGDPSKPQFTKVENLRSTDLFIGLSSNFEKNLFACSIAYKEKVPYTIALVRYPEHTRFISAIPLTSLLNPAIGTANQIMHYHQADTITARAVITHEQAECLELMVSEQAKLCGMRMKDMPFTDSRVIGVRRQGKLATISEEFVFEARDQVLLFLVQGEAERFKSIM